MSHKCYSIAFKLRAVAVAEAQLPVSCSEWPFKL